MWIQTRAKYTQSTQCQRCHLCFGEFNISITLDLCRNKSVEISHWNAKSIFTVLMKSIMHRTNGLTRSNFPHFYLYKVYAGIRTKMTKNYEGKKRKRKIGWVQGSHEVQDGQVALNFKHLTKHSHPRAPRPFRPRVEPFGIVAGSVTREATDRAYQIKFHCHTVSQNPLPNPAAIRCGTYVCIAVAREQSRPDINPGRKHKSKSPTPVAGLVTQLRFCPRITTALENARPVVDAAALKIRRIGARINGRCARYFFSEGQFNSSTR